MDTTTLPFALSMRWCQCEVMSHFPLSPGSQGPPPRRLDVFLLTNHLWPGRGGYLQHARSKLRGVWVRPGQRGLFPGSRANAPTKERNFVELYFIYILLYSHFLFPSILYPAFIFYVSLLSPRVSSIKLINNQLAEPRPQDTSRLSFSSLPFYCSAQCRRGMLW